MLCYVMLCYVMLCMYVRTYVRTYLCNACMYVCTHVCMNVCMHYMNICGAFRMHRYLCTFVTQIHLSIFHCCALRGRRRKRRTVVRRPARWTAKRTTGQTGAIACPFAQALKCGSLLLLLGGRMGFEVVGMRGWVPL